ncbi:MAG: hypothetical protein KGH57_02650 [Candidatus Micrarchaeota archaeon]|nr:hypothetical protein [Candidatus Micrarchaeota archaeon]
MSDDELTKKYNALYLEMIMRYREKIEEGEKLHLAELPKLVTPGDESVMAAANKIREAFPSYTAEKDFPDAARKSYDFVSESIVRISPPLQFWLKPSEVISIGAGDVFDQAVLLCSMLISLGNLSAKVIASVKNDEKNFAVYYELNGKLIVMEFGKGVRELKDRNELLANMGIYMGSEATGYEFNDKMYSNLA